MSEDLFRIVYCSRNSLADDADGDAVSLDQILATSRRNNASCGVTGALLYSRGLFVQTLEGPYDAVQTVFERIQIDPRHDEIVVLDAKDVTTRLFSEWSMAHSEPENPETVHTLVGQAMLEPQSPAATALTALLQRVLGYQAA